jgi:hypothetical protein
MKLGACLGVLLCCSLPLVAYADDPAPTAPAGQGLTDEVSEYLKGQSIQLGLSYSQGTFKMRKGNTSSQLTDNGRATAIIDYTSPEHVLGKFPMKYGDAVLGINLSGSFGQQQTQYQLNPSSGAIIGQDLGSKVTGDYLAGDPFLYLRLGPLYPGTDSYWLFGYGPGVALYHFSGNPIFYTPQSNGTILATSMPVSGTTKLFLYQTWRWQFHYGNWDLLFTGKQISGRKVDGYDTSYEDYGLGVAYSLHF